jgi:predicted nucleic acid-binding protein
MKRIFLDTNIYIIGQLQSNSNEEKILSWLGFYQPLRKSDIQVIILQELINQILRVSKRVQGKDWGSKIVDQIWYNLNCLFIPETEEIKQEANQLLVNQLMPREDIYLYLTAKDGQADCFISGNKELIKTIADFECITADNFIKKYV